MSMRGVVMIPHFEVKGLSVTMPRGNLVSPALLRRSAVYWDKIDIPENMIVRAPIAPTPEVSELMAAGVLTQTVVDVTVGGLIDMGSLLLGTQWTLFDLRDRQEPGSWAIAQDAVEIVVVAPQAEKKLTAEVELHNLLPVPGDDVPIAEVLEFKQRRKAELERLRAEMDSLSERIGNAQNVPRTRDAAIDGVQTAVADAFRVMQESFVTKLARRIKIGVSLGTAATAVAAVAHVPLPTLVVGAASMIGFTIQESLAPKDLVRTGPFAYVHDMMSEIM